MKEGRKEGTNVGRCREQDKGRKIQNGNKEG
jgi:hypothetical protein